MISQAKRKVPEFRQRMNMNILEFRKMVKGMSEFKKRMKRKMSPQTKRKITLHHSGYISDPSGL
jgi:hypothetical protein